ncbi:MAG: agmatine deiminase family protein [Campylobacterota bacterium]|nr:agmatine deiminase family protein [Campylobacterota bacterium]
MRRLLAEFEKQSFIQIVFPHENSDWSAYLDEASETFVHLILAISRFEPCLVVCDDVNRVRDYFSNCYNLTFVQCNTDDTWARDSSGISIIEDDEVKILNFNFNGWGNKFEAKLDNAMTASLASHYATNVYPVDFVLEGGAIESDGAGALLSTSECLLNFNRNGYVLKQEIEDILKKELGIERVLWLHHGYLRGDDTDSHIDTLARFINEKSIMYVSCDDRSDEHFDALLKMKEELQQFTCKNGDAYNLIPLPMVEAKYYKKKRLPATYANFLMLNDAVLVPTYDDINDEKAINIFKKSFPTRNIVPIDCSVLIRQHGSLHCVTMQFYKN